MIRAPVQEWMLAKSEPGRGEDLARSGTCCGARGEPLERIAGQRIADCDGFLFPRGQVDNGDGDCIAWNHWISGGKKKNIFYFFQQIKTYTNVGVLKASGWMELMLSPLSQGILAKLAFLTSPSCFSENGAGLAAES